MSTASAKFGPFGVACRWGALNLLAACYLSTPVFAQSPIPSVVVPNPVVQPDAATLRTRQEVGVLRLPRTGTSQLRVVVRSYETASISAEVNARITQFPPREGTRFREGDTLVAFDCTRIAAEHDAAIAMANAQKVTYANQALMLRYRAAGSQAVDKSRYELEKYRADERGLAAKRKTCSILAPFDGRVVEKIAQLHEVAQPNQPLLKIVNELKLEMVLMVPSHWLSKLVERTTFRVTLDESKEAFEARIVNATGLIDPVSQSARLIAEFVAPSATIVPGMSGTASFPQFEQSQ